MKGIKPFYIGKFKGRIKSHLKVEGFTVDDIIDDILALIPRDDDGELKIYKINIISGERRLVKKVLIISELFISEREERTLIH